ncbi:MAG: hypothetical protein K6A43_03345 [Treponema sp.]|nr:hypothetical protein [Treponema sp.]
MKSLAKTYFFLIFCFLFISSFLFAEVPLWLKQPEKLYPSNQYIKAIGEATSVKSAQSAALETISLYFDTKTEIVTVAVEQIKSLKTNQNEKLSRNQSLEKITNITSNAEFFCVNFTEPFYDKKTDKYSVLAYIEKAEAAKIYTNRIQILMEIVQSYRNFANNETEIFLSSEALKKANALCSIISQYITNETIIVGADKTKFKKELETIAAVYSDFASIKKQMTFSIKLNQEEKKFDSLFSTVASVLEKEGYSYSLVDSEYKIIIDISCIEENYETGPFVRASLDVFILNREGKGVYTYSKAYPRFGSTTMEKAYTRTITKVKQDLEENFLVN